MFFFLFFVVAVVVYVWFGNLLKKKKNLRTEERETFSQAQGDYGNLITLNSKR